MEIAPSNLFGRFVYIVPRDILGPAITTKVSALQAKIAEREERIAKIRRDNEITDAVLVDLLRQAESGRANSNTYYSVSKSVKQGAEQTLVIGAGVVASLQAENDAIDQERNAVRRMERVARNLAYVKGECEVTYDELRFLDL